MEEERGGSALRIAVYYALFGVGWIFFTDLAAEQWAGSEAQLRRVQTAKGWLFILASAVLIWALVRLFERRRDAALREAREAEARMRRAQRIARIGNWEYDVEADHLHWSDEIYEIFGVEPESFEQSQEAFYRFVHPEDLEQQKEADRALLAGEGPLDHRHRIVRPEGEVRHVHERAELETDEAGEPIRLSGTVQDVTEIAELEEQLERSRAVLQRYARHLIRAREGERRALAREMHDELGQTLTALRIQLGQLREQIAAADRDGWDHLETSLDLAGQAMQQLRQVVAGLRPGVLNELGLVEALRHLAAEHEGKTGCDLTLDLPEADPGIGREDAIHVYRVAQEALTNVARHAGADRVEIRLAVDHDVLELTVEDDGRGFDPGSVGPERAHGLTGMEERARLLEGELRLGESPTGGAEVCLRVPLPAREDGIDSLPPEER